MIFVSYYFIAIFVFAKLALSAYIYLEIKTYLPSQLFFFSKNLYRQLLKYETMQSVESKHFFCENSIQKRPNKKQELFKSSQIVF